MEYDEQQYDAPYDQQYDHDVQYMDEPYDAGLGRRARADSDSMLMGSEGDMKLRAVDETPGSAEQASALHIFTHLTDGYLDTHARESTIEIEQFDSRHFTHPNRISKTLRPNPCACRAACWQARCATAGCTPRAAAVAWYPPACPDPRAPPPAAARCAPTQRTAWGTGALKSAVTR